MEFFHRYSLFLYVINVFLMPESLDTPCLESVMMGAEMQRKIGEKKDGKNSLNDPVLFYNRSNFVCDKSFRVYRCSFLAKVASLTVFISIKESSYN